MLKRPRGERRPDWQHRAYRFRIEPVDALPQDVWDTANRMRWLWNDLVTLRAIASGESRVRGRDAWTEFNAHAAELVRRSGLNWECGPTVRSWFDRAVSVAKKDPTKQPKIQYRTESVCIPHIFTGGGVPASRLFLNRSKRVSVLGLNTSPTKRQRLTSGYFKVGESTVRFRIVFHRDLPESAVVKQVLLKGSFNRVDGWIWHLVVNVEEPDTVRGDARIETVTEVVEQHRMVESATAQRGTSCGIDFGWRKRDGDGYLRVAMIVDDLGVSTEVRLPLDGSTAQTRRHDVCAHWHMVFEYDSQIGRAAENAKQDIAASVLALGIVNEHQFAQMRQGGLVRLMHRCENDLPAVHERLRLWLRENDRLSRSKHELQMRLIGRREWLYRNFAAWLCLTYRQIAWEKDLGLQRMAEEDDMSFTSRRSQKYRRIAAISTLRRYIREASQRYGASIVEVESKNTTTRCHVCGDVMLGTAHLGIECQNGHVHDQDENAAKNLLSTFGTSRIVA